MSTLTSGLGRSVAVVAVASSVVRELVRNEPLNVLPPDFVMTLTTPPAKRPYSAVMPEVEIVCLLDRRPR